MRLALSQMDIIWEDKAINKIKAEKFVIQASDAQADLLLFPEMCLTGFSMNVLDLGENTMGETVVWFGELSQKYNICIGFGYIERQQNSDKGKNSYCVVDNHGNVINMYSKIHPFSYGKEAHFYTGGDTITNYKIAQWTISSFICYDLRFPEIFQAASKNSHLVTVAANWPKARINHWETLLKARAIENQCYIAGVNRTGTGDGLQYSGNSIIVDPAGDIVDRCDDSEGLLVSDIDIENVYNIRNNFRLKDDRRENLYASFYTNNR